MRFVLLLLFAIISFSPPARAVIILNIKNDRVLLDLESENWHPGDRLIAKDESGKGKALLEVKQIKGHQAVAAILKGSVETTYTIAKRTPKEPSSSEGKAKSSGKKLSGEWGLTLGLASNSMTVKPSSSVQATLSGSSSQATFFYQRSIDEDISTRIFLGYHSLQASGTSTAISACATGGCKVDIGYLGIEALARYSFLNSQSVNLWGGAGLGFLYAMNKTSNVLDTEKITTNQTILFSLGVDWKISGGSFIPLQLDYALFPDNSVSSANQLILRLGYGTHF